MFAICVESSHARGMGHCFRAINMIKFLREKGIASVVFVNADETTVSLLREHKIILETVDFQDVTIDWETQLIEKYKITTWINDRLNTEIQHANNVKKNKITLITFDDTGSGAALSDLNIAALVFENRDRIMGCKVLTGIDYLVLNPEINDYKRVRTKNENLVVTLGGSDTYGVTVKVMKILQQYGRKATIVLGPNFSHWEEIDKISKDNFVIKTNVVSLIKEFSEYDVAITGGGITPFEANAMGLPCIIIANEQHEIEIGRYLERMGTAIFAGYYKNLNADCLLKEIEVEQMSKKGISFIKTNALENIYGEIIRCQKK